MFATDISPARRDELLTRIAQRIIDFRLAVPAIVLLEASKPLSFIGSQFMIFVQPLYRAIFTSATYDELAALLEERSNVELLIQTIERLEDERGKHRESKA